MVQVDAKRRRVKKAQGKDQPPLTSVRFQTIDAVGGRREAYDVCGFVIGLGATELEIAFSPSTLLQRDGELMIEVLAHGGFLAIGHGCGNRVVIRAALGRPQKLLDNIVGSRRKR